MYYNFCIVSMICITCMVIFTPRDGAEVKKTDAMAVFQLSHSHDVCFQALNR